jgi:short-subunit dehydrogenase
MELRGKTALVTGATGGLGRAIARALHERGAQLILSGRREDVLEELRGELGDGVRSLPADLAGADSAAALAREAGDVEVLVANAALPASGRYDDFAPEEIDRALDVNLRAPVQLARALAPGMVQRGDGHLVFVSSLSGKLASAGGSVYSATKFGLRGFAGGLREDLHGSGVGVTVVFPGFVGDAGMFADANVKLPPGVGTSSAADVGRAVVRGIEKGRAEIDVAPLPMRAGAYLAGIAPGLSARVQRRLGAAEIAERMAEGQREKR